jgi:hypothetical protein
MALVYDPRKLLGVMTARLRVTGASQTVSELTLVVSRVCTGQLRRIRWHTGQGCEYVCMTCRSSGRDTVWYICC